MDKIDRKLVEILQKDSRLTLKDLADVLHLSPSAVRSRIEKLEDHRIISGYRISVNLEALPGEHFFVTVKISGFRWNQFFDFINCNDAIIRATQLAGDADFLVEVFCEDKRSRSRILDSLRQFGEITPLVIDKVIKRGIIRIPYSEKITYKKST